MNAQTTTEIPSNVNEGFFLINTSTSSNRNQLVFDPGATHSIVNNKVRRLRVFNGETVKVNQVKGSYEISTWVETEDFGKALYLPDSEVSLISQNAVKKDFNITLDSAKDEYVLINKKTLDEFYFRSLNGLYVLNETKRNAVLMFNQEQSVHPSNTLDLQHRKLEEPKYRLVHSV